MKRPDRLAGSVWEEFRAFRRQFLPRKVQTRSVLIQIALLFTQITKILVGPLMVAQWLRYCHTNRKVAGSIPDGVIGIFH
jgi:hypothetical protein